MQEALSPIGRILTVPARGFEHTVVNRLYLLLSGSCSRTFRALDNKAQQSINFGKLAVASYRLIRYHKRLWLIGLIAGTVPLGGWNCNVAMGAIPPQGYSLLDELPSHLAGLGPWLAAGAGAVFIAVAWCRGAVIGSLEQLSSGQPAGLTGTLTFGRTFFWRLLPLYPLTVAAALAAILLALGLMTISLPPALSPVLVLLAIILLAAALIALTMLFEFASRAVVLEKKRPLAAAGRAARLLAARPVRTLTVFAHSFFLSVAGIIIVLTLCLVAAIPAFAAWVYALRSDLATAPLLFAVVLSLPAAAIFIYLLSSYNSYFLAYWNLAYAEFTRRTASPPPA